MPQALEITPAPVSVPPQLEQAVLRELLSAVIREFLEACGAPCVSMTYTERSTALAGGQELGTMISLRGRSVRGGLAFVAPVELVAKLHPVLDRSRAPDGQIRDWCLEMANRILGRLKNKLAPYGVEFDVGTPVCFSGRSIRLVFVPDASDDEAICLAFEAASSELRVHLDCSLQPGALARSTERLRIAAEGEVMLF